MEKVQCNGCYDGKGKVLNIKYEDEHDKLTDQMNGYQAFVQIRHKYSDGAVACSKCNGTGFVENEE